MMRGIAVIAAAMVAAYLIGQILGSIFLPCEEGATKCGGFPLGRDLYACQEGKWVMVEKNSPECGYKGE